MMTPKKFIPGTKIASLPGDTLNALREGELRDRALASQGRQPESRHQPFSTAYVKLIWYGDDDLPPGSVVALTEPLNFYEDDNAAPFRSLTFKCDVPTASDIDGGFCAITCTPITQLTGDNYGVGFGYIPGGCWAQVNISDADHTHANWEADSTELKSDITGLFPIIAKPTGTGVKWCVVQLAASGDFIITGLATAAVDSLDSTFTIDNLENVTPGVLPSEPLTVNNTVNLALADNQKVYAILDSTGDWETWGGQGEQGPAGDTVDIIYFQLTADLDYNGASAAATVITSTDGASGSVTVTNDESRFCGLSGYKGYAYHDGTEYKIISMESFARFADCSATARSDRETDTITADIDYLWGNPPNGKAPASLTSVTIHKLPDHDTTIESGDKFRAVYNEVRERWELFWFDGLRLVVKGTVAGTRVTAATSTFTLATPTLVSGWRLPTATITVANNPPMDAEIGDVVYARHNLSIGTNPLTNWDTGDGGNFLWKLRGLGSYNEGLSQVILQDADNDPEWAEAEEIDVITELTSLSISGGNLVLTFKKAIVRVVKVTTAEASDTVTIAVTECA